MNSQTASVQDMGVNHRRADVSVAQQLLDRPNIIPILQQVGGKGVAKRAQLAGLEISAFSLASLKARCTTDSCRWCLRCSPVTLSV
jgi:hypothetical protein